MSKESERVHYLRALEQHPGFKKYVLDPMENMRVGYEKIVRDGNSSMEQIRHAQGALAILDWHRAIFEHNEIKIDALERKEKVNGGREPNYTEGRYCT